jgi:hypothetical protein
MNRYKTPAALRRALEDRLLASVRRDGGDIQRLRRQAAFDRLLCRLFHEPGAAWLLKGGYAMELRIQAARTTRDIDLAIRQLPDGGNQWDERAIRGLLERAADIELQDGFAFTIRDSGKMDYARLGENIRATFRRRHTHDVPSSLPPPDASWNAPFRELAEECGLETNLAEQHGRLGSFLGGYLK